MEKSIFILTMGYEDLIKRIEKIVGVKCIEVCLYDQYHLPYELVEVEFTVSHSIHNKVSKLLKERKPDIILACNDSPLMNLSNAYIRLVAEKAKKFAEKYERPREKR